MSKLKINSKPITTKVAKQVGLAKVVSVLALVFSLSACVSIPELKPWIKPYERQNLADPLMQGNRHPIANNHIGHVYEGRESARGAEGNGGGGCGCN